MKIKWIIAFKITYANNVTAVLAEVFPFKLIPPLSSHDISAISPLDTKIYLFPVWFRLFISILR